MYPSDYSRPENIHQKLQWKSGHFPCFPYFASYSDVIYTCLPPTQHSVVLESKQHPSAEKTGIKTQYLEFLLLMKYIVLKRCKAAEETLSFSTTSKVVPSQRADAVPLGSSPSALQLWLSWQEHYPSRHLWSSPSIPRVPCAILRKSPSHSSIKVTNPFRVIEKI